MQHTPILTKLIFWAFFILSSSLVANANNLSANAIDTIAGYSTVLSSNKIEPEVSVNFRVEKPDQGIIYLAARSNSEGYAETEIDGYHTKTSGEYFISLAQQGKPFGPKNNFTIFPADFSAQKSTIHTNHASISTEEAFTVQVYVKDIYNNPISGHLIHLISSRSNDTLTAIGDSISNKQGLVSFEVMSQQSGVAIFTAMDMNISQAIEEREKVVFYNKEESFMPPSNIFTASILAGESSDSKQETFGIIDSFDIEFPNEVEINDDQNFLKIIAKDSQGKTVRSYTGTIKIAVSGDDNAILPNEGEYTFNERDQGEKEFALAMIFTNIGEKKIKIYDFENKEINLNIYGEKAVNVIQKKEENPSNKSMSSQLVIKSPIHNSILTESTLSISGLAVPNTNLKLMLDEVKVSNISVDLEGFYSTTINDLEDGEHSIYILETEGERRASESISFHIDSSPPLIETINIFPEEEVYPENSYTITIYSEPKIETAKIRINGIEETLIESAISPGKYEGDFFAPKEAKKYNIDVMLTDEFGNEAHYKNQQELHVIKKIIIKPDPPHTLIATPGDMKIDLSWKEPQSEKKIDHYVIYMGQTKNDLQEFRQSKSLSILLPNLENNTEYFFAVTAIDTEGEESEKSLVIQSTPVKPIQKIEPKPIEPVQEIKETLHAVAAKKTPLRSIAGDKKITLSWDPFPTAQKYKIMFGIRSHQYENSQITQDNISSYVIKDLLNNLPYYVSIIALDSNGFPISENYPEIRAIPKGTGISIVPAKKSIPKNILYDFSETKQVRGNTGPETSILIFLILSVSLIMYSYKKKNMILNLLYHKTSYTYKNQVKNTKQKMQF